MTNWRERGYVPPSDGEESDAEISTQDTDELPHHDDRHQPASEHISKPSPISKNTGADVLREDELPRPAAMQDGKNLLADPDDFMDIDEALGSATQKARKLDNGGTLSSQNPMLNLGGDIAILDLSDKTDDNMDEEEGGVELMNIDELSPLRAVNSSILQGRNNTIRFNSPDPLTGELQPPSTPIRLSSAVIGPSSVVSSPLSSPRSVHTTPPSSIHPPTSISRPNNPNLAVVIPRTSTTAALSVPAAPSPSAPAPDFSALAAPLRSFRQRKPIQVNPYLIEQERYRQTFQARGLKPLRIRQAEEEARRQARDGDSQDAEYVAPPEPQETQHRPRRPRQTPEIDDSLDRRRSRSPRPSAKRRRMSNVTYSKKNLGGIPKPNFVPSGPNPRSGPARRVQSDPPRDIYDIPDSSPPRPTRSRPPLTQRPPNPAVPPSTAPTKTGLLGLLYQSDSDSENSLLFRSPPRPESPPFGTQSGARFASDSSPVIQQSSPPVTQRPRQPGRARSSESSPPPPASPVRRRLRSISISSDSSSPSESSSEQESYDIRKLQKRTTGVLPASYWRLDLNKRSNDNGEGRQPQSTRPTRQSPTPFPESPKRGVARAKVNIQRTRSPSRDIIFEDESQSSEESIAQRPQLRTSDQWPIRDVIDLDADVEEHDKIDYMLQAPSRRTTGPTKKRKRRSGARIERESARHLPTDGPTRTKQTHLTGIAVSKRSTKSKPRAPQLGIVDSTQHHQRTAEASPPLFLKYATRQARQRKDQGRHSPSKKLFVLESREDTEDVQSVLREWREGTLPFAAIGEPEDERHGAPVLSPSRTSRQGHRVQTSLASAQPLGISRTGYRPNNAFRARRPIPAASAHGLRQTTLLENGVSNSGVHIDTSRQHNGPKPLAVVPNDRSNIFHMPQFVPRPAQFEVPTPGDYRSLGRYAARPTTPMMAVLHRKVPPGPSMPKDTSSRPKSGDVAHSSNGNSNGPMAEVPATTHGRGTTSEVRKRRKRVPRRVDIDIVERRQPPQHEIIVDDEPINPIPDQHSQSPGTTGETLEGLLQLGSRYALTFDIAPLKEKTYFNGLETFIGKGHFKQAMETRAAQRSANPHTISYLFNDSSLQWGAYDESVATNFESILEQIADATEKLYENSVERTLFEPLASKAYSFFTFFSTYLSQALSFPDMIDLVSFGQRIMQAFANCCERISAYFPTTSKPNVHDPSSRLAIQTNAFGLVFALQLYRLASVDEAMQKQLGLEETIRKFGRQVVSLLLRCGLEDVISCYDDQRQRAKYESGIGLDHYTVEAWVIAMQTLDSGYFRDVSFWGLLNRELHLQNINRTFNIQTFERLWRTVFALLPLQQFNTAGTAHGLTETRGVIENWALVKLLANRPLKVYQKNPNGHTGSINDYCRTIYARCHILITKWHWKNADVVIPALFEFFSNNNLVNLRKEDDKGSPDFLCNLDQDPSLDVKDSDRCFHLLLKVIAAGLKLMAKTSTKRKLSGLVNRLMPNHRRHYPKDKELRIEDLVSLRNNHDLLETLYWAAPPDSRPPLESIRTLVDLENSHRKACDVAVRAWSNLLRFQLHTNEDADSLNPFMHWFDDLATKTLNQHNAARSEAQKLFHIAQESGNVEISNEELEDNIRRNQRQLEVLLIDLLKLLRSALAGIEGNVLSAIRLLTKASTSKVLNSYTLLSPKVVIEVLSVLQQFVKTCNLRFNPSSINQESNEESQDYADIFVELESQENQKKAANHLNIVTYDSLQRMLSNCFGADKQPEDLLLVKAVDTWTVVAGFLVRNGLKTWNLYLNDYGRESWSSLRETLQKRKFASYFALKLLQGFIDAYESNKFAFISVWIRSLVERESILKFQNEFTAALLNADSEHPILTNPPFARDGVSGAFTISSSEFRVRRISLITTVLANMRESFETAPTVEAKQLRKQEYGEMLRGMMASMKENYEEVQSTAGSGTYVDFVHQIIEAIHQHASDLVEIDKFFTDSSAFPLPATDPTYVVGRLKNYGLKLASNPRAHHRFVPFFMGLCERAATDGQQNYLVTQLAAALSGVFEAGDTQKPTLRAFFYHALFPPYIQSAFDNKTGAWILAAPLLNALQLDLGVIVTDIDSTFLPCVQSVLSMFTAILDAIRRAVERLMSNLQGFSQLQNLGILTLMLHTVSKAVPTLAWLSAGAERGLADSAIECTRFLIRFAGYARKSVLGAQGDIERPLDLYLNDQQWDMPFDAAKKSCAARLRDVLTSALKCQNGRWILDQGMRQREVTVPDLPEEGLGAAVEELLVVAARTEEFADVVKGVDREVWEFEYRGRSYAGSVKREGENRGSRALLALGGVW